MEDTLEISSPYKDIILKHIPDLLIFCDRNSSSSKFGCFNRDYWDTKTTHYSSPVYQTACLPLAILYKNNFENNKFYNDDEILKTSVAAMIFCCKLQNSNGSFNNKYPNCPDFFATSSVCSDLADAFLLLKNELAPIDKNKIIKTLIKAGKWLVNHNDFVNYSSYTASLYAIYSIYLAVDGYEKAYLFREKAQYRLERILIKQNKDEGWFPENKSCDPSYFSNTLANFAKYYKIAYETELIDPLKKGLEFLSYFSHPDGSLGGEYGIRMGDFLNPIGIEISLKFSHHAHYILKNYYQFLNNNNDYFLNLSDYGKINFINMISQAFLHHKPVLFSRKNDFTKYTKKYFQFSDLGIRRNKNYYSVINLAKGGIFKLFYKNKFFYNNSGYYCILSNKSIGLTGLFNQEQKQILDGDFFSNSNNELITKISFLKLPVINNLLYAILKLLRLFNNLFGKITPVSKIINGIINHFSNSTSRVHLPIEMDRIMLFEWYQITITDRIILNKNIMVEELGTLKDLSTFQELFRNGLIFHNINLNKNNIFSEDIINRLNMEKELKIKSIIKFYDDPNKEPEILFEIL